MRKISFTILVLAGITFGLKANGQTATSTANTDTTLGIIAHGSDSTLVTDSTAAGDYFPGKWSVTVFGTPNGDAKMTILLERKDGKLGGSVQDSTGKDISKITQADEQGKTITLGFNAEGYDVTLTLDPVDENNVKGSLLGMFDAKGIRVKETANP